MRLRFKIGGIKREAAEGGPLSGAVFPIPVGIETGEDPARGGEPALEPPPPSTGAPSPLPPPPPGDELVGLKGEGHASTTAHRDPTKAWKILAAALALANLAAFLLLVKPVGGGSVADLEARLNELQSQIRRQQMSLRTAKNLVGKAEDARSGHERFMLTYFLDRRTMSSTILAEIKDSAGKAGLVPKEHSFGFEPIEGSENLGLMTITANYEGNYSDLVHFVHLIDKSPRFLIIDNIQAAPQQQSQRLTARFKINAFVREMPAVLPAVPVAPPAAAPASATAAPALAAKPSPGAGGTP